jgi:beta-galactosidase
MVDISEGGSGGHSGRSLNPGWLFAGPIRNPGDAPHYRGRLRRVDLPHTVTVLSWRDWDPASWEGFWLYRKVFDTDTDTASGVRHLLRFEGAMTAAYPWLNGHELPGHVGGYLPFEYEITDSVRATGNRLDVVVDGRWEINTPPNRPDEPNTNVDLWQPAGLYRGVSLIAVPANYLADVFARPRNVLDEQARTLDLRATVDVTQPAAAARIEVQLWDSGVLVAEHAEPVSLREAGRFEHRVTLSGLNGVQLWSPERPKLYRVVVRLHSDGRVDEYRTNIGFRHAEFTSEGFFLNERRLHLIGSGRHHYFPFTGSAMPPRVQRRDAEILKRHGHNMVRCTVYPQDVSFLDACDELGLLVYDEAPGWGHLGDEEWRERSLRDVREMIVRDRNHPSVVLWGARLNETPDHEPFYRRAQEIARELDDSRQTTGAMIFFRYDSPSFQQDVFSYNDYARDGAHPMLCAPRRDRPYLVSEAVGALAGPAKFYRRTDPVEDQHGQAVAHALVHEQGRTDAAYCGVLGWSSYDYQSANGNQQYGVKSPGVFDMFREPKLGAGVYTAQVDPAQRVVIQPAFYWDFQGRFSVHNLDEAFVFSNAERLELFVDDVPHTSLRPDRKRFAKLPYPPFVADLRAVTAGSELRIDAYVGGELAGSRRFDPDPAHDRLEVSVDDEELVADGSDATRVVFRTVDPFGALRPGREGPLRIDVAGPVTLVGDNPFRLDETGGVGAVWLRARHGEAGEAVLRAEHDTLGAGEVRVRVRRTG